jgi:hypothetical protein
MKLNRLRLIIIKKLKLLKQPLEELILLKSMKVLKNGKNILLIFEIKIKKLLIVMKS